MASGKSNIARSSDQPQGFGQRSSSAASGQSGVTGYSASSAEAGSSKSRRPDNIYNEQPNNSGSSGGVVDLQQWLKYESSKRFEESLAKLNLDTSKIQGKHLVSYSLDDLNHEKKRVKNELKVYDQEFINRFKRAPNRTEKEPMRNLYMYYKRLKQYIEKREKMEAGKAKNPSEQSSHEETKDTSNADR